MVVSLQKFLLRLMNKGRLRLLFIALIGISIFGIIISYKKTPDVRLCFIEHVEHRQVPGINNPYRLDDVLQATVKPTPGRSIFFHETSCHRFEKNEDTNNHGESPAIPNILQLTSRQACAIESAALHNPNLDVFVLFASPTYRENLTSQPQLEAILSYSNVHLRNLNLWTYAAGTPMYEWLNDGKLFQSHFVLSHLSDFLRYLTLYRYGGTYLDMDIIMLRSIEQVPPNFSGAESNTHLAAGVMNFASDGFGHEVAEQCLRDFLQNFDGSDWGNNGPGVITRVAQSICGTRDIALMTTDRKRCMGFKVFNRDAFYAIPWVQWTHFFEPEYLESTLERTRDSYVVHVWNKHSSQRKFKVGSSGAYGKFAEQHCPKVYAASGEYF